jgi:ubiquinone/menaquinone biosynthesis C-methylase UbiE
MAEGRRDRIAALYDARWRALERDGSGDRIREALAEPIAHARRLMGDLAGLRVLDLGAGRGDDALHFASSGATVHAIDVSTSSTHILERRAAVSKLPGRVLVSRMHAEALAFRSESFDLVFINAVMMHLDHAQVLAESYRVMKRGGRLVFLEPLDDNPAARIYRRLRSEFRSVQPHYVRYGELVGSSQGLLRPRRRTGFFLLTALVMPLAVARGLGRGRSVLRGLIREEARLLGRMPWLQRFCWILVGELSKEVSLACD